MKHLKMFCASPDEKLPVCNRSNSDDQKMEFIDRMSKESKSWRKQGELDKKIFASKWGTIREIIDAPERYFITHHFDPAQGCPPMKHQERSICIGSIG
jgi:hypothetical protein